MTESFAEKLQKSSQRNRSLLCVGLDPDPALMPVEDIETFGRSIIEATSDLVCAYKPNLGFYEALGTKGILALQNTLRAVPPEIPIIGDAKRGDVHKFYARALFEVWGFDAATVNPYGGHDTIEPFLSYKNNGVFVWCRSSNPGAREIQDLLVSPKFGGDSYPLYEWIATIASSWNGNGNVGLVVGATYPDELRRLRDICPQMPILIPGIGAQLGALEKAVEYGVDGDGTNAIISASRSVIYASNDPTDYPHAARREAEAIRTQINSTLTHLGYV